MDDEVYCYNCGKELKYYLGTCQWCGNEYCEDCGIIGSNCCEECSKEDD